MIKKLVTSLFINFGLMPKEFTLNFFLKNDWWGAWNIDDIHCQINPNIGTVDIRNKSWVIWKD